ncbi:hypothetical protein FQN57_004828 [Myotisia sp. PD_48]|nr:hypothetical protein FQN57_004828 [Myotisia sp. PD_48]
MTTPKIPMSITGPPFPKWDSVSEVYRPLCWAYQEMATVSQNNRQSSNQVQHIDTVRTWRGLLPGQAEELQNWERIFIIALTSSLKDKFSFIDDYSRPYAEGYWAPDWSAFRRLPVNIMDLATKMIDLFGDSFDRFRWFASTGSLVDLVTKFIRTHDCFTASDERDQALIGVKVRPFGLKPLGYDSASPTAEIRWEPDYISFPNTEFDAMEGEEVYLTPRLTSPSMAGDNLFHRELHFITSANWLHWDSKTCGFRGIVPYLSDPEECKIRPDRSVATDSYRVKDLYNLPLTVTAITMDNFGHGVKYEQMTRVRIFLHVYMRTSSGASMCESMITRNYDRLETPKDVKASLLRNFQLEPANSTLRYADLTKSRFDAECKQFARQLAASQKRFLKAKAGFSKWMEEEGIQADSLAPHKEINGKGKTVSSKGGQAPVVAEGGSSPLVAVTN